MYSFPSTCSSTLGPPPAPWPDRPGTIYVGDYQTGTASRCELDVTPADWSGYLDSWPLPGDQPAPWLAPNARTFKAPRWLPPRCHLPALVPRRDFPRQAPC